MTNSDSQWDPITQLTSTQKPYVTWLLVSINVVFFFVAGSIALAGRWDNLRGFLLLGDLHAQFATGAIDAAAIDDGEWWRLASTSFVHQDFFHLLINMSTFLGYGRRLEPIWGRVRFILIYLFSAILGSGVALWYDPNGKAMGSAAAVSGVLVSMTAWYLFHVTRLPRQLAWQGIRQSVMAFGWLAGWWALLAWLGGSRFHWPYFLGGAVGGAAMTVPLALHQKLAGPTRHAFLVLTTLVPIISVGLVVYSQGHHPGWADAVAKSRARREQQARQAEQKRQHAEQQDEIEQFNNTLLPEILKGDRFFERNWRDIEDLVKQPPAARNRGLIEDARRQLRQANEDVAAGLAAIANAPRFTVDRVAAATRAARTYLHDVHELISAAENCLAEGRPWNQQFTELLEQTQRSARNFNRSLRAP
jgi:membrane associated rhomboid family serine protease